MPVSAAVQETTVWAEVEALRWEPQFEAVGERQSPAKVLPASDSPVLKKLPPV
jgi:hypothetical protein